MPTIFEKEGYRVRVYTRDEHPPPHVHVERGGAIIAIRISLADAEYCGDWSGREPSNRESTCADAYANLKRDRGPHRRGAGAPTPRERPWGKSVTYSRVRDEIRLVLDSGTAVVMPRKAIRELRALPQSHMRRLRLISDGHVVALELDDVHIYVPGLVRDMTGYGSRALHPRQIAQSRRALRKQSPKRKARSRRAPA